MLFPYDDLHSTMHLLNVNNISKKEAGNYAVNKLSFSQNYLQRLAIAGETGSGKTTLLKMIAGWIQPDEGTIHLYNDPVLGPEEKLMAGRKEIAYLSQHFELRNNYWVHEILEYANELSTKEAKNLYRVCRVDHLLKRRTDQLSGGEKQRIALARLLSSSPQLLLLDEPFSNLDRKHKQIIKSVLRDITDNLKISCILVSHDAQDVLSWAERILVMNDGQIIQQGSPTEVYQKPVNSYCAELFGEYNLIDPSTSPLLAATIFPEGQTKKFLIRPENIKLDIESKNCIKGIVQNCSFFGNYYLIDVLIEQMNIKVEQSFPIQIGDEVFLSFSKHSLSFV